jgi:small ligand-binding sensory domain FIST
MKVASSLVGGRDPSPELAAEVVHNALQAAGVERADSVLLFLSRDYVRHAQPAIIAAARAAGTTQISGCTAYGLLNEQGWLLDQSGAVALVIAQSPAPATGDRREPLLSFSGHHTLPYDWQALPARAGLLDAEAVAWAHGRLAGTPGAEVRLPGMHARLASSPGLRLLGLPLTVTATTGYDLRQLGGLAAVDSLQRCLPAELRDDMPLHHIVVVRAPDVPAVPILMANADGSLTLAEALEVGEQVHWAIRQPLSAEQDMREALRAAVNPEKIPDFALMFSCLGRGPLFYGNDDRDLLAFREQFPGVPLIGAYGSGQIAPVGRHNRLFQNTVVTLLFESTHV